MEIRIYKDFSPNALSIGKGALDNYVDKKI
jgi:hypothetical protein